MELSNIKDPKTLDQVKKVIDTFLAFKSEMELVDVVDGLHGTYIKLQTKEPVRMGLIKEFEDDLSYALGIDGVEIEAPIKGSSFVGVNVPKENKVSVPWKEVVISSDMEDCTKVTLGKDELHNDLLINLYELKHLLISGAPDSGKSSLLNVIINSLLRNEPGLVKFIMIDPRHVDLTLYNKIPHLLTPVITEVKKAILSLKWASKEMERRFGILEKHGVRDVVSFHKEILVPAIAKLKTKLKPEPDTDAYYFSESLPETMPYIIIIIDELADLMSVYPKEMEAAVVKLAQMSGSVGIHLVITTSRPNIKVFTSQMRDLIPARISLKTSSGTDSKVILGSGDALKLKHEGDMLLKSNNNEGLIRGQVAYISDEEIKNTLGTIVEKYREEIMNEIALVPPEQSAFKINLSGDDTLEEDDLYEDAREAVTTAGKASTPYIQRRLGVGYSRAAKIMDMLEVKGVIGPANGSKPRDVITSK